MVSAMNAMSRIGRVGRMDRVGRISRTRTSRGFTVIELLVVLAALALLLSVAGPRYSQYVDRARDTALRHNLHELRNAIDKFRADQNRYPATLQELVERRYLRAVPTDPVTERADTWKVVPPPQNAVPATAEGQGVYEVRSGAEGQAADGSAYASW